MNVAPEQVYYYDPSTNLAVFCIDGQVEVRRGQLAGGPPVEAEGRHTFSNGACVWLDALDGIVHGGMGGSLLLAFKGLSRPVPLNGAFVENLKLNDDGFFEIENRLTFRRDFGALSPEPVVNGESPPALTVVFSSGVSFTTFFEFRAEVDLAFEKYHAEQGVDVSSPFLWVGNDVQVLASKVDHLGRVLNHVLVTSAEGQVATVFCPAAGDAAKAAQALLDFRRRNGTKKVDHTALPSFLLVRSAENPTRYFEIEHADGEAWELELDRISAIPTHVDVVKLSDTLHSAGFDFCTADDMLKIYGASEGWKL